MQKQIAVDSKIIWNHMANSKEILPLPDLGTVLTEPQPAESDSNPRWTMSKCK